MEVYVQQLVDVPPRDTTTEQLPAHSLPSVVIKILPSMTLKTLRAKVLKSLKLRPSSGTVLRLWAIYHLPGHDRGTQALVCRELDLAVDGGKEVNFWSLENGTGVGVLLQEP